MVRITLVQPDIAWEDIDANLDSCERKLDKLAGQTDIIIMPELFSTGFTMQSSRLAEPMEGKTVNWMKKMAFQLNSDLAGSIIIEEKGSYYNRLIWMQPDGSYMYYDKRHLFRMGEENEYYSSGRDSIIIKSRGFRFKPLICYDLRFPVWSRNRNDYDVLLYVANWPAQRSMVWSSLLQARAHENQAYVLGVNRVGQDGMGIKYSGDSMALDAKGQELARLSKETEEMQTVSLSMEELIRFREKFPAWKDADPFTLDD